MLPDAKAVRRPLAPKPEKSLQPLKAVELRLHTRKRSMPSPVSEMNAVAPAATAGCYSTTVSPAHMLATEKYWHYHGLHTLEHCLHILALLIPASCLCCHSMMVQRALTSIWQHNLGASLLRQQHRLVQVDCFLILFACYSKSHPGVGIARRCRRGARVGNICMHASLYLRVQLPTTVELHEPSD